MAYAVELVGISKSFGAVCANDEVSLAVEAGSIHGVIGENGAGKSTLMSILYGYYQADAGEIRLDGRKVAIASSADAISSSFKLDLIASATCRGFLPSCLASPMAALD